VREAVINPHMTSSPGVTNDSLQFITRRQKEMEEEQQKRPAWKDNDRWRSTNFCKWKWRTSQYHIQLFSICVFLL